MTWQLVPVSSVYAFTALTLTKNVLVVKPEFQAEAEILFDDLHVEIAFLVVFWVAALAMKMVGKTVEQKVDNWVKVCRPPVGCC